MSEPAYSRSSSPSLTAQVVLRRREKGDHTAKLPSADEASSRLRLPAKQPPLSLASVDDDVDVILRWCCYCGYRVRTHLPACRFHSDLLVLDVGEARD